MVHSVFFLSLLSLLSLTDDWLWCVLLIQDDDYSDQEVSTVGVDFVSAYRRASHMFTFVCALIGLHLAKRVICCSLVPSSLRLALFLVRISIFSVSFFRRSLTLMPFVCCHTQKTVTTMINGKIVRLRIWDT